MSSSTPLEEGPVWATWKPFRGLLGAQYNTQPGPSRAVCNSWPTFRALGK
jgi:hypothetical protein